MCYKLQGSTKNALCGVSPLSNRKVFLSYHQPSFLYGTDTMQLNATDMDRIEVKYRKVLKCMLSVPDCTTSAVVYFSAGVLPASAQRDVEILGLLGQLGGLCENEAQSIRNVIEHTLSFYDVSFKGWSSLVRKACLKYGLPDPLAYLKYPWRPDRWRDHCKKVVIDYWETELLQVVKTSDTLKYVDTEYLSLAIPMRVWQMAGLNSISVRQATVQHWMLVGVYYTRAFLFKMKKISSALCLGCKTENEDLNHLILHCTFFATIRDNYLPKYLLQNNRLSDILGNEDQIIQTILDPLSEHISENIRNNWNSVKTVYEISRQFCYDLHRKREKLYSVVV